MLVQKLLVSPLDNEIWSRHIDLLIPRSPHMTHFTDTSYEGLDGFSVAFNFKWRISSDNLAALGWPVLTAESEQYKPFSEVKLYINVLKFLTVFVNTWISIKIIMIRDAHPGG